MPGLYARVFLQILDSSIAEDFELRHVFEDFLKLVNRHGIVDVTREAMARRINLPLEQLNAAIEKLEKPDPSSRDQEFEGRRIERLDAHRDWGWKILNWEKYDSIRDRFDVAERVARHRARKKQAQNGSPSRPQEDALPPEEPVASARKNASVPVSEADVRERAKVLGLDAGQAVEVWKKWVERGGKDGNGKKVRNFDAYLKAACVHPATPTVSVNTARLLKEFDKM